MTNVQNGDPAANAHQGDSTEVAAEFAFLAESARMLRQAVELNPDAPVAEILDGILNVIGELYLIVADHDTNPLFNRLEALYATDPELAGRLDDRAHMLGIELEPVIGKATPELPAPDGSGRAMRRSHYRVFGRPEQRRTRS